jgi:glycosyltransferase involved in cell wall biosynthesis
MGLAAVDALRAAPRIQTLHIPLSFTDELSSIGRFRFLKVGKLFGIVVRLVAARVTFRPDIAYFTFCPSGIAFYRDLGILAVLRALGVRVVVHLHGQGIRRQSSIFRGLLRRLLRHQHGIVLSPRLYADVEGILPERAVAYVANCVFEAPTPPQPEIRAARPPRLLFLANIKRDKGPRTFLSALERLAARGYQFSARVAGARDGSAFADDFIADVRAARASGIDVRYVGASYGLAKADLFDWADILVHPTLNDAQPLGILEAMTGGLTVVSTLEGGIPDVVVDGDTGLLVARGDDDALIAAVATLLDDPARVDRLGSAARAEAMRRFSPAAFGAALVAAVEEAAQGERA